MPLADLVALGKFNYANPNITDVNFPSAKGKGKRKVTVELWHPDKYFDNGDQVIAELAKGHARLSIRHFVGAVGSCHSPTGVAEAVSDRSSRFYLASCRQPQFRVPLRVRFGAGPRPLQARVRLRRLLAFRRRSRAILIP